MKKLSEGKTFAPDDLAKLSKVKAKLEIIGDYAGMEKVRDVLKEMAKHYFFISSSPERLCLVE
jgi:hypothetical protein